jgi:hypothetical protein
LRPAKFMTIKSIILEHPGLILKAGGLLLVLILGGIVWISQFARDKLKELEKSVVAPPFRIQLVPDTDSPSAPFPAVQALVESLLQTGFVEAGAFRIWEMPGTRMRLLVQPETKVTACVYQMSGQTTLDLICRFEDGSTLTFANSKTGGEFSRSEQHPSKRFPGAGAADLYTRMLAERGDRPLRPVRIETAAEEFQADYAAGQDWLVERGGYTAEEIRREIVASGQKADSATVQFLRERYADAALKNWWRSQPNAPLPWAEAKDRLVVIHDELKVADIEWIYEDNAGDWETEPESLPKHITSAREAFAFFNRTGGEIFDKIAEKATPLAADFYLLRSDEELMQEAA